MSNFAKPKIRKNDKSKEVQTKFKKVRQKNTGSKSLSSSKINLGTKIKVKYSQKI